MRKAFVAVVRGALALLVVACDDEDELRRIGRIDYYFPEGAEMCEEDALYLDDALARLEDYLGRRPFQRVAYHFAPGGVQDACDANVEGCALLGAGHVYSKHRAQAHELVHLVADASHRPFALLSEGLATALGDGEPAFYGEESEGASAGLDPSFEDLAAGKPSTYEVAGSYVTSLIRRWGIEEFMDLYASVPRPVSEASFERLLEERGTSFAELASSRRDDLGAGLLAGVPLLRCAAPEADVVGGRVWITASVGCGRSGHRRGLSRSFTFRRSVTVEENRELALVTMVLEDEGALSVRSCERDDRLFLRRDDRGPGMLVAVADLAPGPYTLTAEITADRSPQRVELELSELGESGLVLSELPTKVQLRLRGGETLSVPIELPGDRLVVSSTPDTATPADVRLCAGETCVELSSNEVYDVPAGSYELRASSDAAVRVETDFSL